MAKKKTQKIGSRAYIMGDEEHGLTIVFINPTLVLRFEPDELGPTPEKRRSRIARLAMDLTLRFRGVKNVELNEFIAKFQNQHEDPESKIGFAQEREAYQELFYAQSLARKIADGSNISDVRTCLSFKIDDIERFVDARRDELHLSGQITSTVKTLLGKAVLKSKLKPFSPTAPESDVGNLPPWPILGKSKAKKSKT